MTQSSTGIAPVRVLLAGLGSIGRDHATRLLAHPETDLVGVADPSPGASAAAAAFGAPAFADLATAIDAVRPDAVILATPNQAHEVGALLCLERGLPVLVEKPIADGLDAARRIVEAQARTGVPLLVGHHRRHGAIVQAAQKAVRDGVVGDPVAVSGLTLFLKPDAYFDVDWRTRPGAGPILLNFVHDIDLVRAIVGEMVEIQAMVSHARRGFAVEDGGAVLARFANGAIGSFAISDAAVAPWSWELTSGEAPIYPRQHEHCLHIAGSRGALSVPDLTVWHYGEIPSWWAPMERTTIAIDPVDPLVAQIDHFVAVVRGEARPRVDAVDGARTLAVIEAIGEAARTGRTTTVARVD